MAKSKKKNVKITGMTRGLVCRYYYRIFMAVLVYLLDSKLQSNLKTTKFEETKIALEVCYKEIQRLRSEKLAPAKTTPRY